MWGDFYIQVYWIGGVEIGFTSYSSLLLTNGTNVTTFST